MNKKVSFKKYIYRQKKEIIDLLNEISKTEREIDEMVYKLYRITDKEKEIIENS